MLVESGKDAPQVVAADPVALRHSADDWSHSRVMSVRHIWEQVMFDLVVEAAGEPGDQA